MILILVLILVLCLYLYPMNLPLRIARRYLFAKKNTNAINIITGIAVFGLTVGTAAMVLVLSVFNGFEDLITGMYSELNPDLLVTPSEGKYFEITDGELAQIYAIDGVEVVSKTVEEKAYFVASRDQKTIGILKGVDENYDEVTKIDSSIQEGRYRFSRQGANLGVLGYEMRNKLDVNVNNPLSFINVYMLKRKDTGPFEQSFRKRTFYPAGTFVIEPEFNRDYILSSLKFAQDLLAIGDKIGALEVKLYPGFPPSEMAKEIAKIIGPDFEIKDRYQQNEAFLKLMQVEKWMSFAIIVLMLLLIAFNLIGTLWMLVLEKRKDIAILKSMGAEDSMVRNIFLYQGILLSIIGMLVGFLFALLIYYVQKRYGIIGIPGAFEISAYPISLRYFDFFVVGITVAAIGFLASLMPARRAKQESALIREE